MYTGQIIFAQLLRSIPHYAFRRVVTRYGGDHGVRSFSCWDQFVCLAFGQLTFRESLRDLELGLRSRPEHLYHLGLRGRVCRSTLAEAIRALKLLRTELSSINFEEIARVYLSSTRPAGGRKTLPEAIEALLLRKKRANKRESYRARLKRDLMAFARDFPRKMVNQISQQMIENWVFDDSWKPITQRNRRRDAP